MFLLPDLSTRYRVQSIGALLCNFRWWMYSKVHVIEIVIPCIMATPGAGGELEKVALLPFTSERADLNKEEEKQGEGIACTDNFLNFAVSLTTDCINMIGYRSGTTRCMVTISGHLADA